MTEQLVARDARVRISASACLGLVLGVVALISIPTFALGFAFGSAAISAGLVSRERLRTDATLTGVPISIAAVALGTLALLFTAPTMLLTLSAQVSMAWPFN